MTDILYITASARQDRSLSRGLGARFLEAWRARRPEDRVIARDVGANPPPAISQDWIAAAFTAETERSRAQRAVLALSDTLIGELAAAQTVVIATPMYNYAMPAALKAWLDQVVRVNATFTFDLARGDHPLDPVLSGKTLVLLTSAGEFGFAPGGSRAGMDHLTPHLRTVSRYLGAAEIHRVGIEYQEFGDARHRGSVAAAEAEVERLAAALAGRRARSAA
ncbi:NAD(P)H-dependent oxidoreductase [Paralimibaculum aggregatum]|uniref:FMN dependent NADH:quinone oxidoreductase n=1 Tax=Paralimibaculum aggregatum TaxID=3036245 RepID=A0ABQ6LPQ9_9RHOB|nr:NAD(P)H-dependent oxidoreductase [Limibaculum sp. NKW23]GMG82375.1 NAD(P)H-dependent oxidoreductase [Limibaculum sp. NKW23]